MVGQYSSCMKYVFGCGNTLINIRARSLTIITENRDKGKPMYHSLTFYTVCQSMFALTQLSVIESHRGDNFTTKVYCTSNYFMEHK